MSSKQQFQLFRFILALGISLGISMLIIFLVSKEPWIAISYLLLGPFGSMRHFLSIFAQATPLIFTGLALSLCFKSGNFSMITDACLYISAVLTAALAIRLSLPFPLHPLVILLLAAVMGGMIGSLPALAKLYFKANELVTSLMLNYVFFYLGLFTISKYFAYRDAGTFASLKYAKTAVLPILVKGSKLHLGFFLALLLAVLFSILLYKTRFGYELRLSGSNPSFAKMVGISSSKVILLTQVLAGMVAGLGGAVEQMGMYQRFNWQESPSYAWDGVIIAILSRNNPALVPVSALFLAYIRVGADIMSRKSDVQNELVAFIQALLILFVTAEAFLSGWEHRREVKESLAAADTALPAAASTKPAGASTKPTAENKPAIASAKPVAESEPAADAMAAPAESNPTVVSTEPASESDPTVVSANPAAEGDSTVVSTKPEVETEPTASAPLSESGKEEA